MTGIKFYNKYIINSYFISNFNLLKLSEISKVKHIKLKLLFTNSSKVTSLTSVLAFSILTQTRPKLIKGLKNYKENKVELAGLEFIINRNKFSFLDEFLGQYLADNMDSFVRLKVQPKFINNLMFYKFFDSLFVDKIYEINGIVRNSQQIKFKIFIETYNKKHLYNSFLFNILIHKNILPRPL